MNLLINGIIFWVYYSQHQFASVVQTGTPAQPVYLILAQPNTISNTLTSQINAFGCELCGPNDTRVYKNQELEEHKNQFHNTVIISYPCPISTCKMKFALRTLLKDHMLHFCHEGDQMESAAAKKKKYACNECEMSFSSKALFQSHLQWHIKGADKPAVFIIP